MKALLFAALCTVAGAARAADPGAAFDGKWKAEFTGKSGRPRQAELVLAGGAGTLAYARSGGKWDDACIGPELPFTVASRSATEVKLRVDAESVIKGCGRYAVTLRPGAGADSLEGEFANGIKLKLTRY